MQKPIVMDSARLTQSGAKVTGTFVYADAWRLVKQVKASLPVSRPRVSDERQKPGCRHYAHATSQKRLGCYTLVLPPGRPREESPVPGAGHCTLHCRLSAFFRVCQDIDGWFNPQSQPTLIFGKRQRPHQPLTFEARFLLTPAWFHCIGKPGTPFEGGRLLCDPSGSCCSTCCCSTSCCSSTSTTSALVACIERHHMLFEWAVVRDMFWCRDGICWMAD